MIAPALQPGGFLMKSGALTASIDTGEMGARFLVASFAPTQPRFVTLSGRLLQGFASDHVDTSVAAASLASREACLDRSPRKSNRRNQQRSSCIVPRVHRRKSRTTRSSIYQHMTG